jgi:hypothetical protein
MRPSRPHKVRPQQSSFCGPPVNVSMPTIGILEITAIDEGLDDYSQRPGEGDVQEGGQAQRDNAFCWRQPSRCLFGKTAHFLRN